MKIYFDLDENNHLNGYGSTPSSDNDIELEVDENHDVLLNPYVYKYENGELFLDEEYQQFLIEERKRELEKPTRTDELEKAQSDLVFTLMMNGVI